MRLEYRLRFRDYILFLGVHLSGRIQALFLLFAGLVYTAGAEVSRPAAAALAVFAYVAMWVFR